MIAPLAVTIAIAGNGQHGHVIIGKPDSGCHRQGPAMQTVKGIALGIMGKLGALTNTRNNGELVGLQFKIHKDLLQGVKDSKITTARTPGRLLALVIIKGKHGFHL
jgi:hypothetical protein